MLAYFSTDLHNKALIDALGSGSKSGIVAHEKDRPSLRLYWEECI